MLSISISEYCHKWKGKVKYSSILEIPFNTANRKRLRLGFLYFTYCVRRCLVHLRFDPDFAYYLHFFILFLSSRILERYSVYSRINMKNDSLCYESKRLIIIQIYIYCVKCIRVSDLDRVILWYLDISLSIIWFWEKI